MAIGPSGKKNKSDFNESSPWEYFKPIPKSGTDKWSSALDGGRSEINSDKQSQGKVPKSGGDGIGHPRGPSGKRNSGDLVWKASDSDAPIAKSMPEAPREPKKWTAKGYDMSLPTTLAAGKAAAAKMKRFK